MLLCRADRPGHCASTPATATYPHPFWNYYRNSACFTDTPRSYSYCHLFARCTNPDSQAAYRYPGTNADPIFSNAGHCDPDPCTQYGHANRNLYAYSGHPNQYPNRDLAPKPYPDFYRNQYLYLYPYLNRNWNSHGYGYRDSHRNSHRDCNWNGYSYRDSYKHGHRYGHRY
jgi:hypothetical protein